MTSSKFFKIKGVSTTINTNIAIMRNRNFALGNFSTDFLANETLNIGLESYVITISRQFGSLGRPVAKKLAEILGIEYYDRDIVEKLAAQVNMPVPEFEDVEEPYSMDYEKMRYPLGTSSEQAQEQVFEAQSKIISDLAERGSCIFVGRCSDYILRNHANHFSVFIYAPYEVRRENCIRVLHMEPEKADQMIAAVDEARQSYSMHYAKTYSENVNYKDILIDSSSFGGVDETAKVLADMVRKKFNLAD